MRVSIEKIVLGFLLKYSGIYSIYDKYLSAQIIKYDLPNHIAIILDGNRRWAKYNYLRTHIGHNNGADRAEDLLNWVNDLGIKITTLYVLSTENLDRENYELQNIFSLLQKKLELLYDDPRIHQRRMKIKAIGDITKLPKKLQDILMQLENVSNTYDSVFLNIAIAYGGQKELVDAIKKIAINVKEEKLDVNDIDEKLIESNLYTSHLPQAEPDLILRTSGEQRLSGFLLWQSAYSELIFMDIFWPDFRKIDLMRAIRTYQKRKRRFGK